jgi:hypothetical protein
LAFPSTFKNLQDAVISRLNLDATADLSITKDFINQAYAETCAETEVLQTSGAVTAANGDSSVADLTSKLSGAIQRVKAVAVSTGGVTYPTLVGVSLDEILRLRVSSGGAAIATGAPSRYAMVGSKTMEFWPTANASTTFTFYYSYLPTVLSGDSDVPDAGLPEPYATRCLTFGALAQAADFTNDPAADSYGQQFEFWKGRLRAHITRRRQGEPGSFSIFQPGPAVPHDPAQADPWSWRS